MMLKPEPEHLEWRVHSDINSVTAQQYWPHQHCFTQILNWCSWWVLGAFPRSLLLHSKHRWPWFIYMIFFFHFRSSCEAGGGSASGPLCYHRYLSCPHTPLSGDSDWNMDYYKEQLAVRNRISCFYIISLHTDKCTVILQLTAIFLIIN